MSKHTLSKEIQKELERLNDRIDRKIVRGLPFRDEARRHKELLATLQRMHEDGDMAVRVTPVRTTRRAKSSPVRRSLAGGALRRLFGFGWA